MAKRVSSRPKRLGAPGASPSPYAYKHLLSDPVFLKVKKRAQQVQGITLSAIDFAKNEVRFKVSSVSRPGLQHNVVIVFNPVDGDVVERMGTSNVAAMLRRVGVRVYCSCEAWWYWGYQYKSERRSYNAYKLGPSFPKVRNPHLQGFVCKHLWATLGVLASGTVMNSIAKKLKDYVSEQQLEAVSDALSKLSKLKII